MVSAVEDDIAEMERGNFLNPPGQKSFNHKTTPGNREPSSMGSIDTFNSKEYMKGDLLVGFPTQAPSLTSSQAGDRNNNINIGSSFSSAGSKAQQRNSISLNPLAMRSALAGLSDMDDSDDEEDKPAVKKEKPPSPPQVVNPKASGGPEHRPLVGGFAAAAYEAARVDYYKKQGMNCKGHQPRPRPYHHNNYPRYP